MEIGSWRRFQASKKGNVIGSVFGIWNPNSLHDWNYFGELIKLKIDENET